MLTRRGNARLALPLERANGRPFERRDVPGSKHGRVLATRFAVSLDVTRDDQGLAGHALEQHESKTLTAGRRRDEGARAAKPPSLLFVADGPNENNPL